MQREPCVYILASGFNGTLYTGVTSDLVARQFKHREGTARGFTARYGVTRLVWFERHEEMLTAIAREKTIKRWRRQWKVELIVESNPTWWDLAEDFGFEPLLGKKRQMDAGSSPG